MARTPQRTKRSPRRATRGAPPSLVERLARVIPPHLHPRVAQQAHTRFDDDKPIDRIAKGDYRTVARLISGLEDPGAS
jgi:hypothetical protein